ncbi:hypothetical protein KBX37_09990 [Micromonospora sp. U56]|uniref:hypothetical protein n=1 Tax=Micromonospora sp. U56 TaxID=2824900 RepID=UPI001B358674|nr:hypothetical protein [Micromonospora sp. U56]MBQ0893421.1 hypothetical protein [Micromonospora sp. U56]
MAGDGEPTPQPFRVARRRARPRVTPQDIVRLNPCTATPVSRCVSEGISHRPSIVITSYQIGSALGLAAMTAVASAAGADWLGDLPALTDGYSAAFIGAGILVAAGAVIAGLTLRAAKREPAEATEPVQVGSTQMTTKVPVFGRLAAYVKADEPASNAP